MRSMDPLRLDSQSVADTLHLKPTLPERPMGPLPPKPPIIVKPPIPTMASSAEGRQSSTTPSDRVYLKAHTHDSRQLETTAKVIQQFIHCLWEGCK